LRLQHEGGGTSIIESASKRDDMLILYDFIFACKVTKLPISVIFYVHCCSCQVKLITNITLLIKENLYTKLVPKYILNHLWIYGKLRTTLSTELTINGLDLIIINISALKFIIKLTSETKNQGCQIQATRFQVRSVYRGTTIPISI
jgi:hypothetical protein